MLTSILLASALLTSPTTVETLPTTVVIPVESVRQERPFTVGAEMGWNSLSGVGLAASYNLHWRFSLDSALGLSAAGYKVGLRGRYNFIPGNLTPFVGAGVSYATGTLGKVKLDGANGSRYSMSAAPAAFVQGVAGLSWVTDGGFSLLASAGYAYRAGKAPRTSGASAVQQDAANVLLGSGPVVSLGLGYAI